VHASSGEFCTFVYLAIEGRSYSVQSTVLYDCVVLKNDNVFLTLHHSIDFISVTNLMHNFFYSHNITALNMFRAILCSSSGGHIVYIQHMVSSLSMSGRGFRAVHRLTEFSLQVCRQLSNRSIC
jgi:hypothetical protein